LAQRLLDDLHALTHLGETHEIAVIAVAVAPDRDLEFHLGVFVVWLRPPQVPRYAAGAQARPGEPPGKRLPRIHHPDIDRALLPDTVAGQQLLQVLDELREALGPFGDACLQPGRQVLRHTARAEVVRMQARTGCGLMELHQLFAFLESPQAGRDRADI